MLPPVSNRGGGGICCFYCDSLAAGGTNCAPHCLINPASAPLERFNASAKLVPAFVFLNQRLVVQLRGVVRLDDQSRNQSLVISVFLVSGEIRQRFEERHCSCDWLCTVAATGCALQLRLVFCEELLRLDDQSRSMVNTGQRHCSLATGKSWFCEPAAGRWRKPVEARFVIQQVEPDLLGILVVIVALYKMLPRRSGRGRGQFQESGGQNEDQYSSPSHTLESSGEEEAEAPPASVERMDVVIARFQRMNPPVFNDDDLLLRLVTLLLRKSAERRWRRRCRVVDPLVRELSRLRQQQVAQQSGRQMFRPRGQQFKKKSGSGSSGSGCSSSSGSRVEFCGFCGGKNSSTQCVGVQGSCNLCGNPGSTAGRGFNPAGGAPGDG
ncbi:hypothetical protein F511_33054 [Dorcoceras hygrometricum]|uniref:Uncharacterized protein n=1 Tax=Dorcoceras hygrometricum TaxID=472368 RepID=A0A2Z7BDE9_9LAMI|nr:hypothetical protein F511_33054 [Dorcoceras hygrometricum]